MLQRRICQYRIYFPGVIERDQKLNTQTEQVHKMGELGFMGICEAKYQWAGMDTISMYWLWRKLSKIDASACSMYVL